MRQGSVKNLPWVEGEAIDGRASLGLEYSIV